MELLLNKKTKKIHEMSSTILLVSIAKSKKEKQRVKITPFEKHHGLFVSSNNRQNDAIRH